METIYEDSETVLIAFLSIQWIEKSLFILRLKYTCVKLEILFYISIPV